MANSTAGYDAVTYPALRYVKVIVDTDPGASGYFTSIVRKATKIWVYVSEITGATVSLYFIPPGGTNWTKYSDYTSAQVIEISCHPDTQWKIGVDDNNQGTTSTSTIAW
jgi:hypothetical protein